MKFQKNFSEIIYNLSYKIIHYYINCEYPLRYIGYRDK